MFAAKESGHLVTTVRRYLFPVRDFCKKSTDGLSISSYEIIPKKPAF